MLIRAGLASLGCSLALALCASDALAGQLPVSLGAAGSFAALAGSTVTSTGFSTLNGDLGVSPGSSLTGFPPGKVNGTIHATDPTAARAQADLTIAYNDAASRQPPQALPLDVGGRTLGPGVYKTGAAPALGVTGTLTLDGQGDPNAVFVFQVGSALTTAVNSHVNLIGGANAANVFWQVGSSATLGTSSTFAGSILALTSISVDSGVTLDGRALARNGAVTLIDDTINVPTASPPPPPPPPPPASSPLILFPQEVGGDPADTTIKAFTGTLDLSDAGPPAPPSAAPGTEIIPIRYADPQRAARAEQQANAATPEGKGARSATSASVSGSRTGTTASAAAAAGRVVVNSAGVRWVQDRASPALADPPDTTGAIGPRSYLEATNRDVALYTRNTRQQDKVTLQQFIAAGAGDYVTDVQAQWDPHSDRFLYVVDRSRGSSTTANYFAVGWSKTAHPSNLTKDWCHLFVRRTKTFDDYPKLGHSNGLMLIGSNLFATRERGSPYLYSRITVVSLPPAGDASCPKRRPSATRRRVSGQTPVPANTFSSSTHGYVVGTPGGRRANQILTWDVTGPAAHPHVASFSTTVAEYRTPPDAVEPAYRQRHHPPRHFRLDTQIDARLQSAVAMPELSAHGALSIWTEHAVRDATNANRSAVRWYELTPQVTITKTKKGKAKSMTTVTDHQQGTITVRGQYTFNGAISPAVNPRAPTGQKSTYAMIDFSVSGAKLAPQIRARVHDQSTRAGQTTGEVTLARSAAPDASLTCYAPGKPKDVCRWGDYAGASPDPIHPDEVWGSSQAQGPVSSSQCRSKGTPGMHPCPSWFTNNFALAIP